MEIVMNDGDCEVLAELRFRHLRINFMEPKNNQKGAV